MIAMDGMPFVDMSIFSPVYLVSCVLGRESGAAGY